MNSPSVTIVDYGVGNLLSVQRGFEHSGGNVKISSDPNEILDSARVVLPGVGAFGNAMNELNRRVLTDCLREVIVKGRPFLGICLGMQLMLAESEEFGVTEGLGVIPGRVVPIPSQSPEGESLKIPHIGWSSLLPSESHQSWEGSLLAATKPGDSAYFVHSYMAVPKDDSYRIADCIYGGHRLAAVIGRDNLTCCQFHPEKSGEVGLNILRTFLKS